MTRYGWCRETQTLKQRRLRPDCDLCGRRESAVSMIMYHADDLGIQSGTRACYRCVQRVESQLAGTHRRLWTIPCPVRNWPQPVELSADDFRAYCTALAERQQTPPLRQHGWAIYHDKPYADLTPTERRWEQLYREDDLDRMAAG